MERAPIRPNRPWIPLGVAAGLGALMLVLAAGPFDPVQRVEVEVPAIELLEPRGRLEVFPARFRWVPVAEVSYYLVGAALVRDGTIEPLFRQQGEHPVLELEFDPGGEPPPGRYAWEVLAFGPEGLPIAKGSGTFEVGP